MVELPKIRLELDVPAKQLVSMYVTDNRQIEEQVKKGIENALDKLCKDDNLANLVEQEVYSTLRLSFSSWEVRRFVREAFDDRLTKFLETKAKEFAAKIIKDDEL